MYKKVLIAIVAIAMISMMFYPAFAWEYPDKSHDTTVEYFGPRADQLLIQLYASETSEWETGLAQGKIDITDWPLDFSHLEIYNATNNLNVLGYGAEFGAYLFDLNQNNNSKLGNTPNGWTTTDNPMYPNPMGYDESESDETYDNGYFLRHAIAHLVNRDAVISQVGAAAATAIYTPAPPCYGKYADTEILPDGAREDLTHPYDPVAAEDALDAAGFFPIATTGPDAGWRVWMRNGVETHLEIDLVARVDHLPRLTMAQNLRTELEAIKVHVKWNPMTITAAKSYYMLQKKGHIYTAGWSLGTTPDSLILWNWNYYWHSPTSSCYDTSGCNKDAYNTASDGIQYANSQDDAVAAAWAAQISFTDSVLGIAVYANTGFKAMSKTYVGPEAGYTGQPWYGIVNWQGYGIDNFYTFLNARTACSEYGGTIRYGFKTTDIRQMNPIYTEWLWDNTVIDLIGYDSLVARDPYTLAFTPWTCKQFALGTYNLPGVGICNKMTFTLRNDVYFNDGEQLTLADVYYTFVEMKADLAKAGLAKPWWWSNVQDILSFSIQDPLNFEVLLDVKSMWAIGWIGGNRILPKHVWKPICTGAPRPKDGAPWDPTTFAPDINMVAHGPWRMQEYVALDHILLVKNVAGLTVTNNLQDDNWLHSTPTTSTVGYFRLTPKYLDVIPTVTTSRIDPGFPNTHTDVTFVVTDINMYQDYNVFQAVVPFDPLGPIPSHDLLLTWENPVTHEVVTCTWHILDYVDQTPPPGLSYCDRLLLQRTASSKYGNDLGPPMWFHVRNVGMDGGLVSWVQLGIVIEATKTVYFNDQVISGPTVEYEKPMVPIVEEFTLDVTKCKNTLRVVKVINTRYLLCPDNRIDGWDNKMPPYHPGTPMDPIKVYPNGDWTVTYTLPVWITIPEDIAGTYYVNTQLVAPDCKVDLKDVFAAGKAFGSIPGDAKWNTYADINHDYKIDLKDYFAIAKKFGKW